ncbi:hypothetical protein BDV98DRAFT_368381 [Pterulicium gracile]|uniref:Uncharacterized protein n=1 Tax=Pterulicium gracile TaxID=1884261 RepID=A0A5C3Q622_9AGAR|nr:hypothetical protein BDV98DRAFT_368381 [Pterula gracilis]
MFHDQRPQYSDESSIRYGRTYSPLVASLTKRGTSASEPNPKISISPTRPVVTSRDGLNRANAIPAHVLSSPSLVQSVPAEVDSRTTAHSPSSTNYSDLSQAIPSTIVLCPDKGAEPYSRESAQSSSSPKERAGSWTSCTVVSCYHAYLVLTCEVSMYHDPKNTCNNADDGIETLVHCNESGN